MWNRRFPIIASICLCLSLLSVPEAAGQSNALAILTFRPLKMDAMGYSGEILYTLISVLERDGRIQLMPRRETEERLFQAATGFFPAFLNFRRNVSKRFITGIRWLRAPQQSKRPRKYPSPVCAPAAREIMS